MSDNNLTIRNFGPINNVSISLKRYMLFIGTQASGKSTVAKLIAIFKKKEFVIALHEKSWSDSEYLSIFNEYNIHNYFNYNEGRETYLRYKCNRYEIIYENGTWSFHATEAFKNEISDENERIWNLVKLFVSEQAKKPSANIVFDDNYARSIYAENRVHLISEFVFSQQLYIPTERSLVSMIQDTSFFFKDVPLPDHLTEFGQNFQRAAREIKEYNIPFLNIKFKHEQGKEMRIYHDNTHSLLLSESASGVQAIIPIMLVLENNKNNPTSMIIEEPELNLYPIAQKKLMHFLIANSNNENVKKDLTITSHSPYILSILNNCIYSHVVAQKGADISDKVGEVIKEKCWINPDDINAYFIDRDGAIPIINPDTGLISDNQLDSISEEIAGEFDALLDLYLN